MLKALIDLFTQPEETPDHANIELAAAALMVEAATMDGLLDDQERAMITTILTGHYGQTNAQADALIDEAVGGAKDRAGWHELTRVIKEHFDHDQRVQLIEHLWKVVDADGALHDFELSLIRRVAGLLYVDDRSRAEARGRNP